MSLLFRDLRHAWRLLRRQPAFTGVAILTLALGIGTTTAVFTIVNGVLLRPLPYRDPSRLVILFYGHQGRVSPWFSPLNVRDYVGASDAFAEASAVAPITVNMTGSRRSGTAPRRESLLELLQTAGRLDGARSRFRGRRRSGRRQSDRDRRRPVATSIRRSSGRRELDDDARRP